MELGKLSSGAVYHFISCQDCYSNYLASSPIIDNLQIQNTPVLQARPNLPGTIRPFQDPDFYTQSRLVLLGTAPRDFIKDELEILRHFQELQLPHFPYITLPHSPKTFTFDGTICSWDFGRKRLVHNQSYHSVRYTLDLILTEN